MNREEKISLKKATEMELRACNVLISNEINEYQKQYLYARKKALELQLSLLQIKPRTIETLQIGDVLINNDPRLIRPFGHYVNEGHAKEELKNIYKLSENIILLPHKLFEIWEKLQK